VNASALTDRRVHAACEGFEVVRYERAGKWYIEPLLDGRRRERVSIGEAARRAVYARDPLGGVIHIGLPGGQTFDRLVAFMEAA
jgi:hypothetical protein